MAQVKARRMTWNASASPDVVGYNVYVGPASDLSFVSKIDAGQVTPFNTAVVVGTQFVFGVGALSDGDYQLAVTAVDDATNESDPFQAAVWKNVPFDLTAPAAPTSGGISSFLP